MKRTLIIASAAAIAGGVIAFSVASYANSGGTSGGPPASSSQDIYAAALSTHAPATPATPGGQRQLLHGERVVKDKDGTIITIDVQRGTVSAASASSMTVKSSDGTTWTWTLNGTTKVRGANLKKESTSSIKVGDTVAVAGQRKGDTRTARIVADPPPNLDNLRQHLRHLRRELRQHPH